MFNKYLITLSVFSIFSLNIFAQNDWTFEKESNEIKAYSRMKEGKEYYEYRAKVVIYSTLEFVKKAIVDVDNFKKWMPNTVDSKILEKLNDSTYYGYTVTSAPWPASNRDGVFLGKIKRLNSSSYLITQTSAPSSYYPTQSGKVRINEYSGVWKIVDIGNGTVEIDYIGSFNPGSQYPNWVVKNSMIDGRLKTMEALIKELKTERVRASMR
jgi:hypothetical protein